MAIFHLGGNMQMFPERRLAYPGPADLSGDKDSLLGGISPHPEYFEPFLRHDLDVSLERWGRSATGKESCPGSKRQDRPLPGRARDR
jgi:hypothetical protein